MHDFNVIVTVIGGMVLAIGLFSRAVQNRLYISEPLLALALGVAIGPYGLKLAHPSSWESFYPLLEEASRLTLGIALMGVALRLPGDFVFRNWGSLAVMLGLVMPLMFLGGGFLVHFILGLPLWGALLIGAVVTPTDPVVSSSIVTGHVAEENIPAPWRHLISAESGANDGLAYPMVLLPLLWLQFPPPEALEEWLYRVILLEVGLAALLGALLGYAAGNLLKFAESRKIMERTYFLGYSLALSLLALGAARLVHSDGIFAVFVAGLTFNSIVRGQVRAAQERVQEAVNLFFTLPIFTLIGLTLPWEEWFQMGWPGLWLALAILFFRRLPAVMGLSFLLKPAHSFRESLLLGWFGPVGIAAFFYLSFSMRKIGIGYVWQVGTLIICTSILAHGLSSVALTRLYGRRGKRG